MSTATLERPSKAEKTTVQVPKLGRAVPSSLILELISVRQERLELDRASAALKRRQDAIKQQVLSGVREVSPTRGEAKKGRFTLKRTQEKGRLSWKDLYLEAVLPGASVDEIEAHIESMVENLPKRDKLTILDRDNSITV